VVPIWAPAGALKSTVDDLNNFAAAALGATKIGKFAVPSALRAGFKIAEKAYACTGDDPNVLNCGDGVFLSGLAWQIRPADSSSGVPEIVTKNGARFLQPDRTGPGSRPGRGRAGEFGFEGAGSDPRAQHRLRPAERAAVDYLVVSTGWFGSPLSPLRFTRLLP
jgi:hypothetical protein